MRREGRAHSKHTLRRVDIRRVLADAQDTLFPIQCPNSPSVRLQQRSVACGGRGARELLLPESKHLYFMKYGWSKRHEAPALNQFEPRTKSRRDKAAREELVGSF